MFNNSFFRQATLLALATALISGTANFVNKFAVTAVKDPVLFTALKNGLVALLLIGLVLGLKKWPEIKSLTKKQIGQLLAIGGVGGSLPFALFFTGLTKTSALNASLIHKTLFLWVLLLGIPLLKERVQRWQWLGIGLIFAANLFVGGFTGFKYNAGELMILAATVLWATETLIVKITLRQLSSSLVATSRMVFGSLLLLPLVFWKSDLTLLSGFSAAHWGWIGLTALLLTGYVTTWYAALKRAPATYIATLLVPATLVTNLWSAVFVTKTLTPKALAAAVLYLAGWGLTIYFARRYAALKSLAFPAAANNSS